MWKPKLVKFLWKLFISSFPITINIISYSIEVISILVTVVSLAWIMSSKNIFLKSWTIQHHLPSKLAITVGKQTILRMVFSNYVWELKGKHIYIYIYIFLIGILPWITEICLWITKVWFMHLAEPPYCKSRSKCFTP